MKMLVVYRMALVLLAIALPPILLSCQFQPSVNTCGAILGSQPAPPSSVSEQTVFADSTMAVINGRACAAGPPSSGGYVVKVSGSKSLPRALTRATVFLNGWWSQYAGGHDHHVAGLATAITGIALQGSTLTWQAGGVLTDAGSRKIDWCYEYTVVAWNPASVDLAVDDKDGACDPNDPSPANFYFGNSVGTITALAPYPSFLRNDVFAPYRNVAILPRGFGTSWYGTTWPQNDHHLLQVAYDLDHSEVFAEGPPGTSPAPTSGRLYWKKYATMPLLPVGQRQVGDGFATWETFSILKDNDDRRDTSFGEIVSGLTGSDLGIVQPPFSILPQPSSSGCIQSGGGPDVRTEQYVIDGVPYEYAFPVLTGWNLGYVCSDHHVLQAGAWIHDVTWEKVPGSPGRIRYLFSHALRDEGDGYQEGHFARHKVMVVGVKPISISGKPRGKTMPPARAPGLPGVGGPSASGSGRE